MVKECIHCQKTITKLDKLNKEQLMTLFDVEFDFEVIDAINDIKYNNSGHIHLDL